MLIYLYDVAALSASDRRNIRNLLAGAETIGLDFEWTPDAFRGQDNPISLVQLCVEVPGQNRGSPWPHLSVLLLRTHESSELPVPVWNALHDDEIVKIISGNNVHPNSPDFSKFRNTFDSCIAEDCGVVSLGTMARERGHTKVGLQALADFFQLEKCDSASRTSNWDADTLTVEQQEYAAQDAALTLMVYRELQKDCLLRNNASQGTYDSQPFAYGAFRSVAKGKYVKGPRAGDAMVVKWFTTGIVFEESYYDTDVLTVKTATGIINAFNALDLATQKVYLNQPEVWWNAEDQSRHLVEPYMADFRKFNSNTGGTSGDSLMTALSHFSYHHSGSKLLLCDLQGAARSDCYIVTDPVVMSARREYGPTDLGQAGINNFFYHHRCSSLCQPHWRRNRGQYQYTPVMTTTFT